MGISSKWKANNWFKDFNSVLRIISYGDNLCTTHVGKTSQDEVAQSAEAAEYTDCISANGQDSSNECPEYDTKQFDVGVPVMQKLCGMQSVSLLPSLPNLLWPGVDAPDWILSMA